MTSSRVKGTARRTFDYKIQRCIVGVIAILLAPSVTVLARDQSLLSISASYWSDAGSIFISALCVVAMFLAAYNGLGERHDLEFWLAKFAGGTSLVAALIPTNPPPSDPRKPPWWTSEMTSWVGLEPTQVHYVAGVGLFVALTITMGIFFGRAKHKRRPIRSAVYAVASVAMILGLLGGGGHWLFGWGGEAAIYWVEAWMLTWFGLAWMVAGLYRDPADESPR